MALIFAEWLVSLAVTTTAFSRRPALSFTQLSQMPTAHAAEIAAKIAALRVEYNHASRRPSTSFILLFLRQLSPGCLSASKHRASLGPITPYAANSGILMPNSTISIQTFLPAQEAHPE